MVDLVRQLGVFSFGVVVFITDTFVHLLETLSIFLQLLILLNDFLQILFRVIFNLQLVELFALLFILLLELLVLFLVGADLVQEPRICLLSSHKLSNHLLDIRVTGGGSDLLESLFNLGVLLHFPFHLSLKELTPELLDHEVDSLFNFILILAVTGRCLGNLVLALHAINSLPQCLFFIFDTGLQRHDSLLPLFLLVVDVLHEVVQLVLALQLLLARLHLLAAFVIINLFLGPQRLLQVVNSQIQRDQVPFHPIQHVLISALVHILVRVRFLHEIHFMVHQFTVCVVSTEVF